ncbi:hypothetical protein ACMXYR_08025 [Neptuniibacter sp. QD29_5]|uniref:hypothetical protein n=1 Tax=unclassified Neptuniibacter TaxID=2630693 RepID=UPI0039F52E35
MTDLPKGIFILAVAGVIGYQAIKALDMDYLAQSPSSPVATSNTSKSSLSDAQKVEAVLAGADPTDVFESTAAGKSLSVACDSGFIAGDINKNRFSRISYASITERGITYIQVSRYSPTYLVQEHYQAVTATEVSKVPDSIKAALQAKISNPQGCSSQDLYLSQINYLK